MEIRLYARSPDQEFVWESRDREGWPSAPFSSGPGIHFDRKDLPEPGGAEGRAAPLSKFISVRRDGPEFGFVHNLKKNVVFYADNEAIELLQESLDLPLGSFVASNPSVARELHLTP